MLIMKSVVEHGYVEDLMHRESNQIDASRIEARKSVMLEREREQSLIEEHTRTEFVRSRMLLESAVSTQLPTLLNGEGRMRV
jgi:hypothetical protein